MSESITASDWATTLMSGLADAGVRTVVVSPGSRSTNLVLAAHAHSDLSTHVIIDERVAGFTALGLAKRQGSAVALICTSGSAGAHYLPALIEASHAGIALIVLTADRPPEAHHVGAGQTTDQTRLFGPYAKECINLGAPTRDGIRWTVNAALHAVRLAETIPRGAVHINAAFRKPFWQAADDAGAQRRSLTRIQCRQMHDDILPAAVQDLIGRAQRGVIVVGPLIGMHDRGRERRQATILAFAERMKWPVLADILSGMRSPSPSQTMCFAYDLVLRDQGRRERLKPDLVISIGRSPTSKVLNHWLKRCSGLNHIRFEENGTWSDVDATSTIAIEGSADALASVNGTVNTEVGWLDEWHALLRPIQATVNAARATLPPTLTEPDVVDAVSSGLAAGDWMHLASGLPVRDFDVFCLHPRSTNIVANRGVNGIDGMVSTSLGLALNAAEDAVICILGDIAVRHDIGGLLAASESECPLLVVVNDNGGGAIFKRLPIQAKSDVFESYFFTPQRVDLGKFLPALARRYACVEDLASFESSFQAFKGQPGLSILHARIDLETDAAFRHAVGDDLGHEGTQTS
ncbi:MAG: 2-succinyl-5-enolpyruvyl-6-hydroxy-3-cyclohexene-1-carboxylic-acid synthase [Myxococcota bacterium]|nr:2-succinyl-5-enolpyruvyl-6-hydroxy-3-cyclohexene-1-carboxylic-acid synthase [Myxococcota bacterium]